MAGIPVNFQAISNVLPNYNYIDIAAGTGIINFYAGKTVDLNLLSNHEFYSNSMSTTASLPKEIGNIAKVIDLDFDVVLNRPLNFAGIVVLNVPIVHYSATVSPSTSYAYVVAKVRKWNGVTETDICENQSSTISASSTDMPVYNMLAIDLNIPLTHFKIGETLRLTIEFWGYYSAGSASTSVSGFGHDPMNRVTGWDTTGAVPSKLVFQVPTRLNL